MTSLGDRPDCPGVSISMGGDSGFPLPVLTALRDDCPHCPIALCPHPPPLGPLETLPNLSLTSHFSPPSTDKLKFTPFTIHTHVCSRTHDLQLPCYLSPLSLHSPAAGRRHVGQSGPQHPLSCLLRGGGGDTLAPALLDWLAPEDVLHPLAPAPLPISAL